MPKQKDLKRVVRARMKKTGESYTAARSQVTRKKTAAKASPIEATEAPDLATLAGVSDETIRAKTGRTWAQWVKALDAIDAAQMNHTQIATHVYNKYQISGWWAQNVTVGYERIKGLRGKGQRRDGAWECHKSRTFATPVEDLYEAFTSRRKRVRWLPRVDFTLRKATPNKTLRLTWPDDTDVEVSFLDKGAKSTLTIQHRKLSSKEEVAKRKAWWSKRFDALAELLRG